MTAIGKTFIAILSSDQRGPILTRRAGSWAEAIKQAHGLLDQAEELNWFRGEKVAVKIEAAG